MVLPKPVAQPRRHPLSVETPVLELPRSQPLDIRSPVNGTGSFAFDTVLRSGQVAKRRKRTNFWDPVSLVLRPGVLSIYKDPQETRLKHRINLSEVSAVAIRRDRKRKGIHEGVFGVFSPSRNFHLEAPSETDAQAWVEILRREARMDDEDEEMMAPSPGGTEVAFFGFHQRNSAFRHAARDQRISSDTSELLGYSVPPSRQGSHPPPSRPSYDISDMSGSEIGAYPDRDSSMFGSMHESSSAPSCSLKFSHQTENMDAPGKFSQTESSFYKLDHAADGERVIWHGYLDCLKIHSGVKQWKRYWVVLRAKNLGFYKSEDEYAALLILPLSSILDAVETDAVSKSREFCMQIITEDRSYRLSCADEMDLSHWLGALKSTLTKKKDSTRRRLP